MVSLLMRVPRVLVLLVFLALARPVFAAGGEGGAGAEILKTLRAEHPRVFITGDSLAALREGIKRDPEEKALFTKFVVQAEGVLKDAPVKYEIIGPRLLTQSRRACDHISTLGLAYLLTGEKKYADRAIDDMMRIAEFKDWNPSHFLDTAEMTNAMGMGYDWLYAVMTAEQRKTVHDAIVSKGLGEGEKAYKGLRSAGNQYHGWWTTAHHNWSQVCNGGLAVGALAVADEDPELAGFILELGLKSVQPAMHAFAIDGGWSEGPGYWAYATQYTAYYMAALQTGLGSMHDLEKNEGLANAGMFALYFTGPSGKPFNFADAHDGITSPAAQLFFFSHVFNRPVYAVGQRELLASHPKSASAFDLIWYDGRGAVSDLQALPLDKHFRGSDVVFLRSHAAPATEGFWLAAKGGDNKANHSHLDLGSFVLDYMGKRFAVDLGPDDYNLPNYFGKDRFTYFRLRTESHNTLLINGKNQPADAAAPVIAFQTDPVKGGSAVVDLTAAYPMATSVRRGFAMPERGEGGGVVIQDEVVAKEAAEVVWSMLTPAAVELSPEKTTATLTLDKQTLYVEIVGPAGAVFEASPADAPVPQKANPGITHLKVKLAGKVKEVTVVIRIRPEKAPPTPPSAALPALKDWGGYIEANK